MTLGPAPPWSPIPFVLPRCKFRQDLPDLTVLGTENSPRRWVSFRGRLYRVCSVCYVRINPRRMYCSSHSQWKRRDRTWEEYQRDRREARKALIEEQWAGLVAALPGTTEELYHRFGRAWGLRRTRFYIFLKQMEREGRVKGIFVTGRGMLRNGRRILWHKW